MEQKDSNPALGRPARGFGHSNSVYGAEFCLAVRSLLSRLPFYLLPVSAVTSNFQTLKFNKLTPNSQRSDKNPPSLGRAGPCLRNALHTLRLGRKPLFRTRHHCSHHCCYSQIRALHSHYHLLQQTERCCGRFRGIG